MAISQQTQLLIMDTFRKTARKTLIYRDKNLLNKSQAKQRWNCEKYFDEDDLESTTVLDHCHFSGKFLGWAQSNRACRYVDYIPIIAQKIQNLDVHYFSSALNECDTTTTV